MAFLQQRVKFAFSGVGTAYLTTAYAAIKGSKIALNTLVAGTIASTAGLVIPCAGPTWNIEWDSLYALVETNLTTSTLTAIMQWQGSNDGTNWETFVGDGGVAPVAYAAAGGGTLVTTLYRMRYSGNPSTDYIRLACAVGVTTGGTGDNVTVSYGFRKRSFLA